MARRLRAEGFHSTVYEHHDTMPKAVREAQRQQWSYMLVVGENEATTGTVNVRDRNEGKVRGTMSVDDLIAEMHARVAAFQ